MKRLLRALLSLAILGVGGAVAAAFVASKPTAAAIEREEPATHVQVQIVRTGEHVPSVSAMGRVTAEKQVMIQPEVVGRVIEQNHALTRGGRVAAGDPLLRIDPRDYSSALEAMQADLAQARLAMREEKALRKVAEHEWRERPEGLSEETLDYALRAPHLDAAEARVKSVKSRIARARRDLSRTILRAPFDAIVLSESVDLGQTVSPQTPVATLAGIERYWVEVSLPVAMLQHLDIPEVNVDADQGSKATIINEAAGVEQVREGYVVRLQGTVDPRGRMAQLFVAVDDPLGVRVPVEERPLPLLLDTYVRVELQGRPLKNVVVLPRAALRGDGTVWVLDAERRLVRREVEVVLTERSDVVVRGGLEIDEQVVVTPLPEATEGMRVTLAPDREDAEE